MKIISKILIVSLFFIFLFGVVNCNASDYAVPLTVEQIIEAFKEAELAISGIKIYTEETDPNNLLGRPGQYIGKANWADSRIEQYGEKPIGGTIEIFDSKKALKTRKEYIEPIIAQPLFAQYMFVHKNAILRLENELTPTQAEEYNNILSSL